MDRWMLVVWMDGTIHRFRYPLGVLEYIPIDNRESYTASCMCEADIERTIPIRCGMGSQSHTPPSSILVLHPKGLWRAPIDPPQQHA
jgi:hypothetical protein